MLKTKKNKIILLIFFLIQGVIFYKLNLTLNFILTLSILSFILLRMKFYNSMQNNINQYFKEDQITWAKDDDVLIKKLNQFTQKMNLNHIKFGYFSNNDINAYAFEDIAEQHTILIAKEMKDQYDPFELEAVVLHELGHLKHKHISQRMLITNACQVLLLSLLTALFLKFTSESNLIIGIFFILFGSWPFINAGKFLSLILDQYYSRQCEYEADAMAIKIQGSPIHIMKVLTNIESQNAPKSLWQSLLYKIKYNEPDWLKTHPNIDKRLYHAESYLFKLKK